jgi:hypothetical protein
MRERRAVLPLLVFLLLAVAARFLPEEASAVIAEPAEQYTPPDMLIIIDADTQGLSLYEDGVRVKWYAVAVGTSKTPSPLGVWKIAIKQRGWGDGFGTRWMGLNCPWGTYGIHGTNKPGSIGKYASHGCVRMMNRDVEDLYARVSVGTTVIIERAAYGDMAGPVRTMRPGDVGSDVRQAQLRLNQIGYSVGWPDGIYGETTKRALVAFKRDRNLPVTHDIDYATKMALGVMMFE